MAHYGSTRIEATGPQQDRAALSAHVQATARNGFDFALSDLSASAPASDTLVLWAKLSTTDSKVVLSIGIKWDLDALHLARRLSARFPTLRVVGVFVAECDPLAFRAVASIGDTPIYDAEFPDEFSFRLPGMAGQYGSFFERTPDRTKAAREILDPAILDLLVAQLPVFAGWRRSEEDGPGYVTYCQPGTADAAGRALVLHGSGLTLLHGLDGRGGYQRAELLDHATAGKRLPELAAALERHRQEYAADLAATRQGMRLAGDDEDEIKF